MSRLLGALLAALATLGAGCGNEPAPVPDTTTAVAAARDSAKPADSAAATGRNGAAVLVRLPAGTPENPCPALRTLFRLPNLGAGPWRLPRGPRGTYAGSFSVLPRDLRADLPGEELVVRVGRYRRTDAGCCPSYVQTTSWRYDAVTDRFIRYRTTTRRTRAAGR